MSESYAEKQARKAEYFRELAGRVRREATTTHARAESMADVIPFGQPILVGHHSERSDRNFRNRIDKTFRKSFELSDKAEHYEKRAENIENPYAISSDDPEAVKKLKEKVEKLEKFREVIRGKTNEEIWKDRGSPQSLAGWDFKRMHLESIGRRLRDAKKRIDEVQKTQSIPASAQVINGITIAIDQSDNRVKLSFPSIPPPEVRTKLKSYGFHWSPMNRTWQRQISNAAIYYAEEVAKGSGQATTPIAQTTSGIEERIL